MKKIYLAFLWHQHQPVYKNPITGIYELPWVRLHATKDYYDMVAILDGFPKIKSNINLVPSLIMQLEDYACGKAKDRFMDLTLKDAKFLTTDEKTFILTNFFLANKDNMILPYPRYSKLYNKKVQKLDASLFEEQEFRDLQVWFNLSWVDPYWRKNDEFIKYLYDKRENFTEEEKKKLVDKQIEICGKIVSKHKEAQDKGQIEVTVTPFYHPILPLLCDTDAAKEATPKIVLPQKRFAHPEDALWHIENAISYYQERFSVKPLGMWPSEGCVSNAVIELISEAGLKWTATDEAVLFNSAKDISHDRRYLFKPFQLNINGKRVNIIFRDHGLSDSIGFVYSKWDAQDAANDFISKVKSIGEYASSLTDVPLVSVILDGDNCWEYYKNDGWDFLTSLYEKLSADEEIETVRVSDYLAKFPPKDVITNLTAGSWINGNFGVWIGSAEDNKSWDFLSATRDALVKNADSRDIKEAWNALHTAEGSDWNWWYGDEHSSSNDNDFDFLYRQQLIKVYESLGMVAPEMLFEAVGNSSNQKNVAPPAVVISPKIDGKISDSKQWSKSSFYKPGTSGAAMHQVSTILKSFNYGFDNDNLYLKFDFNEECLTDIFLKVIFLKPTQTTITLSFDLENKMLVRDVQGKSLDVVRGVFGKNVELALAVSCLNLPEEYDNIKLVIAVNKNNSEVEIWPYQSTIEIPKLVKV
jgi:alpha-amylase/alpha-mannosidase (GH57 family)